MSRTIRRTLAAALTAVIATSVLSTAASATSSPPSSDEVVIYTVAAADADLVGDLDVVTESSEGVALLGDSATADELAARGVTVIDAQLYGSTLPAVAPRQLSRSAAAEAPYPLPSRLSDKEYQTYFGGYRTVDSYYRFGTDIVAAYPEIAQVVDYGDSWLKTKNQGGHDLVALRLTADVADQPDWKDGQNGRPVFVLGAQTHAREIVTSEIAWRYATELLNGYGTDSEITRLLDTTEVWISFLNNPDGIDLVQAALSDPNVRLTAAGDGNPVNTSKAWQRKNVNNSAYTQTSTSWSSYQPGIDLNRNFATAWGGASTSATPSSLTYKGTAAFSEPEALALSTLLTDLWGTYNVGTTTAAPDDRKGTFVTLHSYSDYVIYPYAYATSANVPNLDALKSYGFRQSATNGFQTGKAGEILYDNAGNDIDWIYDKLGVPAFTYEIGTTSNGGFFPAYTRAATFYAANSPGLRYAATASSAPYVTPRGPSVTAVSTGQSTAGTVSISGTASDATYGQNTASAGRRPATHPVTAVQAAVGPNATKLGAPTALTVTGATDTVTFSGDIRAVNGTSATQQIFVRAKNDAGYWGPWTSVFDKTSAPISQVFTDVSTATTAFAADISWLFTQGLTNGSTTGNVTTYDPSANISRQAFAAFLYRYAGNNWQPAAGTRTFADVAPGSTFYTEVEWLAHEGLATGTAQTTGKPLFKPGTTIDRQSLAAILYRLAGSPTSAPDSGYTDVPPTRQFAAEIAWLARTGITTGFPNNTFRPGNAVTRDAVAAFLHRFDGI